MIISDTNDQSFTNGKSYWRHCGLNENTYEEVPANIINISLAQNIQDQCLPTDPRYSKSYSTWIKDHVWSANVIP